MAIATAAGAKRVRQACLVALAVATLVAAGASPAFAAKGGKGNGGAGTSSTQASISVPDGVFGGTTIAIVAGGSPWVQVTCYATGGGLFGYVAVINGAAAIQLGPTPSWSQGGASCTAQAGTFDSSARWTAAASTSFSVTG